MSSAELRENRTLGRFASGDGCKRGTSDCADEVTLSRKGANSPTRARKPRSTGTKAKARVSNRLNSLSELKKQLEARTRELAEVRGHLSEALEQQTAKVLRTITGSPGDLRPVFEAISDQRAPPLWGKIRSPCMRQHGHQPQDRLNGPPRVHHACRGRGSRLAARGARAAAKPCPKMD